MNTIDYIYRYDPTNPNSKPSPSDAEAARRSLEEGNRVFARWIASCRTSELVPGDEACHIVPCNHRDFGILRTHGGVPKQAPFAVVVGCSDARVPTEMLFGQGFNELFIVRVAGNVVAEVCQGSIDFAVEALRESVKIIVVLGHSGCGAVVGTVDAYLTPERYWSKTFTNSLRAIFQKIMVSVREAASGIDAVWGSEARLAPGYREALIETAVCINAAQAAFALRQEIEMEGRRDLEVFFGVYSLVNHQVSMPYNPFAPVSDENVGLAQAPRHAHEFHTLAVRMAEILRPMAYSQTNTKASVNS